jgi:hypothetical protein
MTFNYAGRLFLIQQAAHKVSSRVDIPFTCGFCARYCGEQERYSTLTAQAEDGMEVSFIFCSACVGNAREESPNMQTPAVERALAAKIDRDGAVQRTT